MNDTPAESFESFYHRVIAADLAPMEERRQAGVRFFYTVGGAAIAGAAAAWLILSQLAGLGDIAIIAGIAILAVGFGLAHMRLRRVATDVKATLLRHVADFSAARFTAEVPDPPAFSTFRENKLLPGYDRSHFEDLLEGERAGASYQIYEAHLQNERRDRRGHTTYVTAFRGQLVRIHVPQRFDGVTLVLRDAGLLNALRRPGRGLKRVGLVDGRFESVFEVYGSDQVEARYLLTPAFMERLLALEEGTRGKNARAAFVDGDLLVAIEGGNLFEAGSLFQPVATLERARRIHDDIATVHAIIDLLVARGPRPEGSLGAS